MGKKRLIIAIVPLAAILGAVAVLRLHSREPVYEGKPLSTWLDQYASSHWSNRHDLDQEAEVAIRHFGTSEIPTYLQMLSTRPSDFKMKLLARVPRAWVKYLHVPTTNDYELSTDGIRRHGAYGLIALGPDARPAVPTLIALLTNKVDRVRYLTVFTIRCLGPIARDALPSVIKCLNDPDFTIRSDASAALGTIHEDPKHVVPILLDFLEKNRDNPILRDGTEFSLGQFGPQAESAVPALLKSLNNPDFATHQMAIVALGRIRAQPGRVVPALTAKLAAEKETSKSVNDFWVTLGSLGQFGSDARPAVPILLQLASDSDPDIRANAIETLKKIDPDAAAKAQIK
jgi:hypothetical protein